jgi:hypothetical protein
VTASRRRLQPGYLCPKGVALKDLHEDPDRLRTPLVRRDGELVPCSWDEAFAEVERRLPPVLARTAATRWHSPPATRWRTSFGLLLYFAAWPRPAARRNVFSASTLDQMPKQLSSGLMFGHWLSVPVPDIERCDYLVIGANPMVSNGSLWTVPDFRGKAPGPAGAWRPAGGGRPATHRDGRVADEHLFIRPGTDVLPAGRHGAHAVRREGRVAPGRLAAHLVNGIEPLRQAVQAFSARARGRPLRHRGRRHPPLARELAVAPRGCVYGRIGTCTQASARWPPGWSMC